MEGETGIQVGQGQKKQNERLATSEAHEGQVLVQETSNKERCSNTFIGHLRYTVHQDKMATVQTISQQL